MKAEGRVIAVCLSSRKGERKQPVETAQLRANHGIEGDAHAGAWHRQISLLAAEEIRQFSTASGLSFKPGDFAENLVVEGVQLHALGLGSRLRIGASAELRINQIGKVCHARCAIYAQTGDCILPRVGLFASVIADGVVSAGDRVEVLETIPRNRFQAVVLTISDRCARGETEDTAGPAVARLLEAELGAHIYERCILPDERPQIEEALRHFTDGHSIDLVVTVGGTGFSPRDVTPEAVRAVAERLTPGLDEAMRAASLRRTPHAALSRAVSGIRGQTLILSLPGSERGAMENLRAVLPSLHHGLAKLRGDPSDCGRLDVSATSHE